jgi:hypothetical protein
MNALKVVGNIVFIVPATILTFPVGILVAIMMVPETGDANTSVGERITAFATTPFVLSAATFMWMSNDIAKNCGCKKIPFEGADAK